MQTGLDYFTLCNRGFDLGELTWGTRLARYHLLPDDLSELAQDIAAQIGGEVLKLIDKTVLEHPFLFRVISNGDLLIGIDVRDLE